MFLWIQRCFGSNSETPTKKKVSEPFVIVTIPKETHKETEQDKKKHGKKQRIPAVLRQQVWLTYIGSKFQVPCLCCQHTAITPFLFECAHVMAESQGGSTTVENLRPCCGMCNRSMGKRNFFEFQKEFFSKKTH